MGKQQVTTNQAPTPSGPYSQAVVAGDYIFLSGQAPFTADGSKVEGGFGAEVRQVFANLAAVASAAGGSLDNAVRIGVFLDDMANFNEMNEIYRETFSPPEPARTTIQTSLPGFGIEVDVILYMGS